MEEEKKDNNKIFKIFVMVLIITSLFLLKEENQEKLIGFINSISSKEKTLVLVESFPKEDILDVNIYDDTIVKWEANKLSFLNIDGSKIVDKEFNFEDPDIYFGQGIIYPMDKSTGDIYYLDKKGETINRLQMEKGIFNFESRDQNVIYHGKSDSGEEVNILDGKQVQIGHYSYDTENVLRYAINKQGKRTALALIDINQESIKTRIDLYGENNERLDQIDIYGEIVVYLEFASKDEIIALTESGIHYIKDGEVLWKKELSLIKDIYINGKEINLLYSNYLEIIDFKGETKEKIGFTEEYKKMLPFKNDVLVYGDNHLVLVQGKKEILKEEIEIKKLYTSKDKILIWGPEELKIYEVIGK